MSDWEEFCESMGIPNDEFADEKLAEMFGRGNSRSEQSRYSSVEPSNKKPKFVTYQDAVAWAKLNPGQTFCRAPDGDGFIIKLENERLEVNSTNGNQQARLDAFSKEIQDWHKTLDKPLEKSDYYDCPNAVIQLPKAKPITLKSIPVPEDAQRKLRENYELTSKHEWFEMIWGIYQYKKYNFNACKIESVGISHAGKCWARMKGKHGRDIIFLVEEPERFFIFPTTENKIE